MTLILIVITAAVSLLCFSNSQMFQALQFNAWSTWHDRQWYRMLSYGLVHAGWGHLLFNMLTLYFFGRVVEAYFGEIFGAPKGTVLYVIFYISALAVSSIGDLVKYRNNPGYNAVGASGAVSAILFPLLLAPHTLLHFLGQLGIMP